MPKREKQARKRALRRERAKTRDDGDFSAGALGDLSEAAIAQPPQPGVGIAPPARARQAERVVEDQEERLTFTEQVADFFAPTTDFLKDVVIEIRKINWPKWEESWRSTRVVIFTILFLAFFMWVFSWAFSTVASKVFTAPITPQAPVSSTSTVPGELPGPGTPAPGGANLPSGGGTQPPTGR